MMLRLFTSKRSAFTLIEALVTTLIVAALLVLVSSVINTSRNSGYKVKCISNLRHIYMATLAFSEDHDGKLPPTLGPATLVDARFTLGQYWWGQAYLGRYAIGPLDRRTDSRGRFTQDEVEVYNCPARFVDRPDRPQSNGNPAISYMMVSFYSASAAMVEPSRYRLRTMEDKAKKLLITEGRGMSLYRVNTVTRPLGDVATGLRRFHHDTLNLLFLDGHVETFSGPDEELLPLHP